VPFSDGIKTLNVVTNLTKAYETEGKSLITDFEKNITLAIVDESWKKHLRKMDEMKQSVQLAVHEQKDPLLIYKFEAFKLFKAMIEQVNKDVISFLFKGELPTQNTNNIQEARQETKKTNYTESKDEVLNSDELAETNREAGNNMQQRPAVTETIVRDQPKINRNDNVTIKNVMSGKSETMKYKKAEAMLASGEYVIVNE
jgi:preprotein translocase subunit SecA